MIDQKISMVKTNFNMTLKEWKLYDHENIVFNKCYWMGVQVSKNPFDMWIYQEIIHKIQPDIIIEIGSANGGSTLYFANLLDCIKKGVVISIDINRANYEIKHERIIEITGNSSSPEIIEKVSELCRDKIVLVNQDSDHNKNQVLEDLLNYSKFVSLGSYFIVEDGLVDVFEEPIKAGIKEGPLVAIEEFLKINHDFVVDEECERYILTYNPSGYLKRIS